MYSSKTKLFLIKVKSPRPILFLDFDFGFHNDGINIIFEVSLSPPLRCLSLHQTVTVFWFFASALGKEITFPLHHFRNAFHLELYIQITFQCSYSLVYDQLLVLILVVSPCIDHQIHRSIIFYIANVITFSVFL